MEFVGGGWVGLVSRKKSSSGLGELMYWWVFMGMLVTSSPGMMMGDSGVWVPVVCVVGLLGVGVVEKLSGVVRVWSSGRRGGIEFLWL